MEITLCPAPIVRCRFSSQSILVQRFLSWGRTSCCTSLLSSRKEKSLPCGLSPGRTSCNVGWNIQSCSWSGEYSLLNSWMRNPLPPCWRWILSTPLEFRNEKTLPPCWSNYNCIWRKCRDWNNYNYISWKCSRGGKHKNQIKNDTLDDIDNIPQ